MAPWSGWFSRNSVAPRVAVQSDGGGVIITNSQQLDDFLREGGQTKSGVSVTAQSAMRVGAVYACVRIIAGAVATIPLHIKKRIDERTREDASDTKLWELMQRKPNRWQKPHQFRRYLQSCVLLKGNAYCHIVRSRGDVIELLPLDPDRMKIEQNNDLSLKYIYQRPNGGFTDFDQKEIFHLFGMTLDGIRGVTPITYARETIGLSLAMEDHGAKTFKNGARVGGTLEHPQKLSDEAYNRLKASTDEFRAGGAQEGKDYILEEGMKYNRISMTSADAQWIESRSFSRSDIAMFFGVPPHMIGVTEKTTSWGSGIEQQSNGFVAFTLEDHLTMWEQGITIDLTTDRQIFARFNRSALVRGDIKTRWGAHAVALQWGAVSPNEVRAVEDMNPREGGDQFYEPPNTAGGEKPEPDEPKPAPEDEDDDAA